MKFVKIHLGNESSRPSNLAGKNKSEKTRRKRYFKIKRANNSFCLQPAVFGFQYSLPSLLLLFLVFTLLSLIQYSKVLSPSSDSVILLYYLKKVQDVSLSFSLSPCIYWLFNYIGNEKVKYLRWKFIQYRIS